MRQNENERRPVYNFLCRCSCGKCSFDKLVGAKEYLCCREFHAAFGKVLFDGLGDHLICVTEHEAFLAFVNKEVLKIVGPLLKKKDGSPYKKYAGGSENE